MNSPLRLGVFLAALVFPLGAAAQSWTTETMNSVINQTNFIVHIGEGGLCSGTLISLKYRLLLTNNHCVEDLISIQSFDELQSDGTIKKVKREVRQEERVEQKSYDGFHAVGSTNYETRIIAHSKKYDLGLLQIEASSLPYSIESKVLPYGLSVVRGEKVWVVGNPLGLDAAVTSGIVSSITRTIKVAWAEDVDGLPFIQTDAGIAGGNSGGALYNEQGYLIGVPAAGVQGTPIGLAIPYTLIRKFLDENCYGEVWNVKAESNDACEASKKAVEKKIKKDE